MKNNNFIRSLSYNINNGRMLELVQRGHDGTVLIMDSNRNTDPDEKSNYIPASDMIMLINFYRYIKK